MNTNIFFPKMLKYVVPSTPRRSSASDLDFNGLFCFLFCFPLILWFSENVWKIYNYFIFFLFFINLNANKLHAPNLKMSTAVIHWKVRIVWDIIFCGFGLQYQRKNINFFSLRNNSLQLEYKISRKEARM